MCGLMEESVAKSLCIANQKSQTRIHMAGYGGIRTNGVLLQGRRRLVVEAVSYIMAALRGCQRWPRQEIGR